MPNCTAEWLEFGRVGRCVIEANFEGGALSCHGATGPCVNHPENSRTSNPNTV